MSKPIHYVSQIKGVTLCNRPGERTDELSEVSCPLCKRIMDARDRMHRARGDTMSHSSRERTT